MVWGARSITVFVLVVPMMDWDYAHPLLWVTGLVAVCGAVFAAVSIVRDRQD